MERLLIRRLGILISILVGLLFVMNFNGDNIHYCTLFISLFYLISSFISLGKYIQVITLYITSIVSIMMDISFGYIVSQIILLALLSHKYEFLSTRFTYKILFTILIYIGVIVFNRLNDTFFILFDRSTVLFTLIGITFLYQITTNNIKIHNSVEKKLKTKILKLQQTLAEKEKILEAVDMDYIDPVKAGLTKAELILLQNLCLYHESNADLGDRLNKSQNTVRNQLQNILIKIGVENRHQLKDVCKNYFLIFNH